MWDLLEAGLLRTVCGETLEAIALAVDASPPTVHGRVAEHVRKLQDDDAYAAEAAAVVHAGLAIDFPGRRERAVPPLLAGDFPEDRTRPVSSD